MSGSVKDLIDVAAGEAAVGEGAAEVRLPCLLGCFFTSPDTSMDAASTTMPAPSAWPRRAARVRERESARERERESERASEREGGREGGKGRSRGGGGEREIGREREKERERKRERGNRVSKETKLVQLAARTRYCMYM